MQGFRWVIVLGCVAAAVGIGMLVWGFTRHPETSGSTSVVDRTPVVDPESLAIYSNGTYGFTFFYPATARVVEATSSQPWRANAGAPGAAITKKAAVSANGAVVTTAQGGTFSVRVYNRWLPIIELRDQDRNDVNPFLNPRALDINKGNRQVAHGIVFALRPLDL